MGRLLRITALVLTGIAVGTVATRFMSLDKIRIPKPGRLADKNPQPKKVDRVQEEEIKSDERFKRIPVMVLTTSSAEEDILKSYNLHANCYITKPVDLDQFMSLVKSIENFWLTIVRLPPE